MRKKILFLVISAVAGLVFASNANAVSLGTINTQLITGDSSFVALASKDTGEFFIFHADGGLIKKFDFGSAPFGIAQYQNYVYVALSGATQIKVIDIKTLSVVNTITTEKMPYDLALDLKGLKLYASVSRGNGSFPYHPFVLDLASSPTNPSAVASTWPAGYFTFGNEQLLINNANQYLYSGNTGYSPDNIYKFNIANPASISFISQSSHGSLGSNCKDFSFKPGWYSEIYLACGGSDGYALQVVDAATLIKKSDLSLGAYPNAVSASGFSSKAYAAHATTEVKIYNLDGTEYKTISNATQEAILDRGIVAADYKGARAFLITNKRLYVLELDTAGGSHNAYATYDFSANQSVNPSIAFTRAPQTDSKYAIYKISGGQDTSPSSDPNPIFLSWDAKGAGQLKLSIFNLSVSSSTPVYFKNTYSIDEVVHLYGADGYTPGQYIIRLESVGNPMTSATTGVFSVYDKDGNTITSSIKIAYPNGGEKLEIGKAYNITWQSTGDIKGVITYLADANDGILATNLVNISGNPGVASWNIPSYITPGFYKVMIVGCSAVNCTVDNTVSSATELARDYSDSSFNISAATPIVANSIKVVSPNGGETWQIGQTYPINWTTTGYSTDALIQISLWDTRYSFDTVIAKTANTGSYNFTVPASLGSTSGGSLGGNNIYKIRTQVYSTSFQEGVTTDASDAPFSIAAVTTSSTTKPDLIVENIKFISTPIISKESILSFNIVNKGAGIAYGPITHRVEGGFGPSRVVTDYCAINNQLLSGQSCSVNVGLIYYVSTISSSGAVKADYPSSISESDETNNMTMFRTGVLEPTITPIVPATSTISTLKTDLKVNNSDQPVVPINYGSKFTASWDSSGASYCAGYGSDIIVADGGVWTTGKYPASGSKTLYAKSASGSVPFSSFHLGIQCWDAFGGSATDLIENILTAFPTTGAVPIKEGSLVKIPSDPSVYVIKEGQKVKINSPQEFEQAGYKWNQIQTVQADLLAQIAELKAQVAQLREELKKTGTLLKAQGGADVYVVKDGKRVKINSPEEFNQKGYKWNQIQEVSAGELSSIPTLTSEAVPAVSAVSGSPAYPDGTLIKAVNGNDVYVIINGNKRKIPDPVTFNKFGYKWDQIKKIDGSVLSKISDDVNIYVPVTFQTTQVSSTGIKPGLLIKSADNPTVYYITKDGMKKPIPTIEVFNSYNNKWQDVKVTHKETLDALPAVRAIKLENGDGKVYILENKSKRWVKTAVALQKLGINQDQVVSVNQTELDAYPDGEVIE